MALGRLGVAYYVGKHLGRTIIAQDPEPNVHMLQTITAMHTSALGDPVRASRRPAAGRDGLGNLFHRVRRPNHLYACWVRLYSVKGLTGNLDLSTRHCIHKTICCHTQYGSCHHDNQRVARQSRTTDDTLTTAQVRPLLAWVIMRDDAMHKRGLPRLLFLLPTVCFRLPQNVKRICSWS